MLRAEASPPAEVELSDFVLRKRHSVLDQLPDGGGAFLHAKLDRQLVAEPSTRGESIGHVTLEAVVLR